MSKAQNFLVRYGLHNFVTWTPNADRQTFVIKNLKNQDLVSHAKHLIRENFGDNAVIRVL